MLKEFLSMCIKWLGGCLCKRTLAHVFQPLYNDFVQWNGFHQKKNTLHYIFIIMKTTPILALVNAQHGTDNRDTCLSFHLQLVRNTLSILLILCKIILYFSDRLQLPATHSVVLKSVFLSFLRLIKFSEYLFAHRNVLTTWIHNKIDRKKNTNQNFVFDQREIERPSPLVGFPFSRFLLEFSVLLLLIWTPHTIHRHHFFSSLLVRCRLFFPRNILNSICASASRYSFYPFVFYFICYVVVAFSLVFFSFFIFPPRFQWQDVSIIQNDTHTTFK